MGGWMHGGRDVHVHEGCGGNSMGMGDFWFGIASVQNAVSETKPADGRHRALSIAGGIAIAVLIGAGLFIVAAING
jgi:hypothetical protein